MTVAIGTNCYSLGASPCTGTGWSWTDQNLDEAIHDEVAPIVFDQAGIADLESLLSELAETNFGRERLAQVLNPPDALEDWRVGEVIAQVYLTDHRNCAFPWPGSRDERKSGSSLPGADLVGFQTDNNGDRFAFGEVKTSGEANYPPQAMYGRTGLKQQLEDLRDQIHIRNDLMKYLGHRASNASWKSRYKTAAKRYIRNYSDVHLFGVLIRDVGPHQDDLRVRVQKLAQGCPDGAAIELLSIYLPIGSIDQLAAKTLATRSAGGDA